MHTSYIFLIIIPFTYTKIAFIHKNHQSDLSPEVPLPFTTHKYSCYFLYFSLLLIIFFATHDHAGGMG